LLTPTKPKVEPKPSAKPQSADRDFLYQILQVNRPASRIRYRCVPYRSNTANARHFLD
jgi:hypothetical protein